MPSLNVTAPLLPRWLGLDAGDKLTVVYEVVKEFMPGFSGDTGVAGYVPQFFASAIGQCGDGFVSTDIDADDVSIGASDAPPLPS